MKHPNNAALPCLLVKSLLNGRQLALKISANAVYGFTSASVGKLPCMDISASTTAYGRQMIESTKAAVEKRYKEATVIYGDTDSVMIKFGDSKSLEESMRLGEEAAEAISQVFPNPVKLEFEECYYPYLLISKKRYAGVESVRRDDCRLVANVISTSLELLLKKQDLQKAIAMVKYTISDLLQNKIDISQLVVSKALTKTDYEAKQAHVTLAEKMRKRDPGTAPSLGDRVPYVITHGSKNEPAYSRPEDPLYVLENNVPIDNKYYLENMLRKPLERIFEPVMGSKVSSLFFGEHTRTVSVVTSKKGALMKYAKVKLSCLGCRSPINEGAICKYYVPKEAEIYSKHMKGVVELEKVYASLWTECQRCMGEICHDVVCSNGDCPISYRRRKAQKDLDSATERLQRFELEW
ncbi:DNA-directed DNA polymerase [Gracilaria domingensis]|nr:DNA-directed DNA polymerase [Gracilaria domingensis]